MVALNGGGGLGLHLQYLMERSLRWRNACIEDHYLVLSITSIDCTKWGRGVGIANTIFDREKLKAEYLYRGSLSSFEHNLYGLSFLNVWL